MTETEFWEDKCPLLQEIAGKEWADYKQNLLSQNAAHLHIDSLNAQLLPHFLYKQRDKVANKLEEHYNKIAKEILGDKIGLADGTFSAYPGPLYLHVELPRLDSNETTHLLLGTEIENLPPEQIIGKCTKLIHAKLITEDQGYNLTLRKGEGVVEYEASPLIKSISELKKLFYDIGALVNKIDSGN